MREIKVRGKRKDNAEWVYGYYVELFDINKNEKIHRIYTGIAEKDGAEWYPIYYEVIPETVGQYTGLKDKNGKEIYEGDIIEFYSHKNNGKQYNKISRTLGIVYWREQKSYDCEYNNKVLQENPSAFNMPTGFEVKIIYREKENYHSGNWSYFANCKVIGNIHDNPELIK